MNQTPLNDGPLDIKRISLDIVRELYSASRKLVMYPLGHPQSNETLKKTIERMNEIFNIKHSFSLQVYANRLAAEGILLDENVFVNGILLDFKRHDLNSVVFFSDVIIGDLYHFLSKLLDAKSPLEGYFAKFLISKGIQTVRINVANPPTLYDFNSTGYVLSNSRLDISQRLREIFMSNLSFAARFYMGTPVADEELSALCGIDFRASYVRQKIGGIVAGMAKESLLALFSETANAVLASSLPPSGAQLNGLRQLWYDYTSKNSGDDVWFEIYEILKKAGIDGANLEQVFDKGTLTKLKILLDAEELELRLRQEIANKIDIEFMRQTFKRLLAGGFDDKVESLFKIGLSWLESPISETRQKGLRILVEVTYMTLEFPRWELTSKIIKEILCSAVSQRSGAEIVELIAKIVDITALNGRWAELRYALQSLKGLAGDSRSNKHQAAIEQLNSLRQSSVLLDVLSDAVISGRGGSELYEAISTLGSTELAAIFLEKVDSPGKEIRARLIRALASMGRQAGALAAEALAAIVGAGEKSDDQTWWRLRNLLRILGTVKYQEAIPYFEILAGWKQKRVKLELINTLEALQSSLAGSLLSRLAGDNDAEVRRAAIAAMGNSGHPDMANYLKTLLLLEKTDLLPIVASLGRLGGARSRDILIDYFENDDHINSLELGKRDEDNLRMAIIKALSKIGDEISKSKVDQYSKQWLANNPRKGDLLTNTAKLLLGDTVKDR